jgi:histone H3/H4
MGIIVKTQVNSLVKEISKGKDYKVKNVSDDFIPAMEEKAKKLIEDAVGRAKANNRRTLMGRDL